eukprot:Pgem_evm1s15446
MEGAEYYNSYSHESDQDSESSDPNNKISTKTSSGKKRVKRQVVCPQKGCKVLISSKSKVAEHMRTHT